MNVGNRYTISSRETGAVLCKGRLLEETQHDVWIQPDTPPDANPVKCPKAWIKVGPA